MPPRVTVIIPTYNWSTVLPYSIGSVLGQTFRDFELLVIGDGCTDDSEQVVRAIGDERVSWINIPRTGHQSGPNNEGIRRARGEIIAYLGHDDLWLPRHLELHLANLDAGADVGCSLVAFVGPEGAYVEVPLPDLQTASFLIPSGFVHRASMMARIGGWRDHREIASHPEAELMLRAMAAGCDVRVVPRLTVVKFPASIRKNVYRTRPHHEQAQWLERIRSEPDLEAAILGRVVAYPTHRHTGLISRAWRLLRNPSRWMSYFFPAKGAGIRAHQRYKGVDDVARRTKG